MVGDPLTRVPRTMLCSGMPLGQAVVVPGGIYMPSRRLDDVLDMNVRTQYSDSIRVLGWNQQQEILIPTLFSRCICPVARSSA